MQCWVGAAVLAEELNLVEALNLVEQTRDVNAKDDQNMELTRYKRVMLYPTT